MKKKIIVVDDQPSFRKTFIDILLHTTDVEIVGEASNGIEFLELLSENKPDIAFVDIKMPEMNGIEATKEALKLQPELVIIGISMYQNQNYIDDLINAGAKGYLLKSGSNIKLLKQIIDHPNAELFFSMEIKKDIIANKKRTIAIVDDFKTNTAVFSTLIKNSGFVVFEANLPTEALKIFDGRHIDLMVCDYTMPEMNGAELIKKIKSIPVYENLPVLMLSSEKGKDVRQKAKDSGAYGWMKKPIKLEKFLKIVDNILK